MQVLEVVPIHLQRVQGIKLLQAQEEVLRLHRRPWRVQEEEKRPEDIQGHRRRKDVHHRLDSVQGRRARAVASPHLCKQQGAARHLLREDHKALRLPRVPQGKGAPAAEVRQVLAQVRLRQAEGRQCRQDARKDVLGLQAPHGGEPRLERLAVRLRRGEDNRQEGDTHDHLPRVQVPVRVPDLEA